MKQRRSRNPIPEENWNSLRVRDPILDGLVENEKLYNKHIHSNDSKGSMLIIKSTSYLDQVGSYETIVKNFPDDFFISEERYYLFSERVRKAIEESELTLDEIADIFGVSHTSIANSFYHETRKGKAKNEPRISRAFLTAYALLWEVSPFFLIGETLYPQWWRLWKDGGQDTEDWALSYYDRYPQARIVGYRFSAMHIIKYITFCLSIACPSFLTNNRCVLPIITAFCNAKQTTRNLILSIFEKMPIMQAEINKNIDISNINNCIVDRFFEREGRFSMRIDLEHALTQLDYKDVRALEILVKFLKMDDCVKRSTYCFLKNGGFFNIPHGFFNKWKCYEDSEGLLRLKQTKPSKSSLKT